MSADASDLIVDAGIDDDVAVLTPRGTLDSATYRPLRNRIIGTALAGPIGVIVNATQLQIPTESALAVFSSASWHVARWPGVPIALVCEHDAGRSAFRRNGVTRHVPVHPNTHDAVTAVRARRSSGHRQRARARVDLHPDDTSLAQSRAVVEEWLTIWSQTAYIPVAKVVATAFVENVLRHTKSRPHLRLETDGEVVNVAVDDASSTPAHVRERMTAPDMPSGLKIVAALSRVWGNAPTLTGKTVWAVLGPENKL